MKTQEMVQKWASLWLSLDIIRKANNKKTFRAQLMALFQPTSWQPAARQLQEPAGSSRSAGFWPAVGFHMPADTSSLVPRWLNRLQPDCTAGSTTADYLSANRQTQEIPAQHARPRRRPKTRISIELNRFQQYCMKLVTLGHENGICYWATQKMEVAGRLPVATPWCEIYIYIWAL